MYTKSIENRNSPLGIRTKRIENGINTVVRYGKSIENRNNPLGIWT